MVIITSKKTKDREKDDFYPTPLNFAEKMIEKFVDYKYVKNEYPAMLDPGMGNGIFGLAARNVTDDYENLIIDGVDTVERVMLGGEDFIYSNEYYEDYLSYDAPLDYNWIIGNPPYSLAEEFIRKSLSIITPDGRIAFLLKLAFLEGVGRNRGLFREFPPTDVHVLNRRLSFDGSGKTNDYAFAVFCWDMKIKDKATTLEFWDWSNEKPGRNK